MAISQKEGLWFAKVRAPEGTTACFLNGKSGILTAHPTPSKTNNRARPTPLAQQ
jgi:hypothetical protein